MLCAKPTRKGSGRVADGAASGDSFLELLRVLRCFGAPLLLIQAVLLLGPRSTWLSLLEVFAGDKAVTSAAIACGRPAVGFEIKESPEVCVS
jgi:hypothetical protein